MMDRYDGSLAQLIEQEHPKGMPVQRALQILVQVADALRDLHEIPLVHGNLKPQNILYHLGSGEVVVTDYALSVLARTTDDTSEGRASEYAAPEQRQDKSGRLSGNTDVWSLGMLAVFVLTGRPIYLDNCQVGDKQSAAQVSTLRMPLTGSSGSMTASRSHLPGSHLDPFLEPRSGHPARDYALNRPLPTPRGTAGARNAGRDQRGRADS